MHLTLRYATGLRVDAVVLAANRDGMRIAIPDHADTEELRRIEGEWISEDGDLVELESVTAGDGLDVSGLCSWAVPRVCAAG